jgi:hypothetical protein
MDGPVQTPPPLPPSQPSQLAFIITGDRASLLLPVQ